MNDVAAALEALRPALAAHAGGVELVDTERGVVTLRYTGMCTGCHLRPLTTASTFNSLPISCRLLGDVLYRAAEFWEMTVALLSCATVVVRPLLKPSMVASSEASPRFLSGRMAMD